MASGSHDYTVIIWDLNKGRLNMRFDGPSAFVKTISIDPLGKYFCAQSCDRNLRIFQRNTKKKSDYFIKNCVNKITFDFD